MEHSPAQRNNGPSPAPGDGRSVSSAGWFANRLASGEFLVAPGAFDAVSARLIERRGFEAVYCGGYAAVASAFGLPDLGLAGFQDMLSVYRRVHASTRLPLIVDADTGYGGPLNVARTVRELSRLGVAAIQIEDQVNPKQCGHLADKEVVPLEEAALRVRIAVETAGESGPAIIARVDSLEPEGMERTIERANLYAAEGAAMVLVDAVREGAHLEEIRARVAGPLMFNAASTGDGPMLSADELRVLGYDLVVYPIEALYAAFGAMETMLDALRAGGLPPESGTWRRPSFNDVNDFLGVPEMVAWERQVSLSLDESAPLTQRTP